MIYAHLSVPPPPLSARRAGLAPGVDEVLGRALAKAPGDRYASCREFAEALCEALGMPGYDRDPGAVSERAAAARPVPKARFPSCCGASSTSG